MEQGQIFDATLAEGWRLACRTVILANVTLHIPPALLQDPPVLRTERVEAAFTPWPALQPMHTALRQAGWKISATMRGNLPLAQRPFPRQPETSGPAAG